MPYLLGIDIGTSGTKTLICDENGTVLASAMAEHPISSPKPGWSEQNPEDWWKATCKATGAVMKRAKIRPTEIGGREALIDLVANPALTGFTAPKILWVRENEPKVYEKTRHILLPKDYIRYRMTGDYATEVSDASGTLLLDVKNRIWSIKLLDLLQIDRALLPHLHESYEVSGKISATVAKELALIAGIPVVGGGGDQPAGAVGNGIVSSGIVSATLGTSGVVFAHSDQPTLDPEGRVHTMCHAVPGKWCVFGCMLAAGGSFQWFRNQLAYDEVHAAKRRRVDPYELLINEAQKSDPGSGGLFFLPYLTGERCPHPDPCA